MKFRMWLFLMGTLVILAAVFAQPAAAGGLGIIFGSVDPTAANGVTGVIREEPAGLEFAGGTSCVTGQVSPAVDNGVTGVIREAPAGLEYAGASGVISPGASQPAAAGGGGIIES